MHVDLVKNEWLSGIQVRLVSVEDAPSLHLNHVFSGWDDLLTRHLVNENNITVQLSQCSNEPDRAWKLLHDNFAGSFIFATDPQFV